MPEGKQSREDLREGRGSWKLMIWGQLAGLLVREGMISPEEQIRFLALVRKGE